MNQSKSYGYQIMSYKSLYYNVILKFQFWLWLSLIGSIVFLIWHKLNPNLDLHKNSVSSTFPSSWILSFMSVSFSWLKAWKLLLLPLSLSLELVPSFQMMTYWRMRTQKNTTKHGTIWLHPQLQFFTCSSFYITLGSITVNSAILTDLC